MGFRVIKGSNGRKLKKYSGITEYFRDSDPDKKTVRHYISYWIPDPDHPKGGRTVKEKVETTDRDEALAVLEERKREVARGLLVAAGSKGGDTPLDIVATEYFAERDRRGNIHKDKLRYTKYIGDVIYRIEDAPNQKGYRITEEAEYERETGRGMGEKKIRDLTPNDIKGLKRKLANEGLGPKTVANTVNLLKAITGHALSEGYITHSPFVNKETRVKVPKEARRRIFTPEEREEIFMAAKHRDKRLFVLFKMLYYTGQRPKSIIGLKAKDIDLKQRTISVDPIKDQAGTTVPIADRLYPILKVWLKDAEPNQPIFNIGYDRFQKIAKAVFAPYNKGLDRKKDPHAWASMYSFRHTSATVMLAKSGSIEMVQGVLNHADARTTKIYAKLADEAKRKGVNLL